MTSTNDALSQQYRSPEQAVQQGADVIIVGRGITEAPDRKAACAAYREAGWAAYEGRL